MRVINWFKDQIKKIKLFFIYRKFEKSDTYIRARVKFELDPVYALGLEFDNSFEKILVRNKYLLDSLENILNKNNLEVKEYINPENITQILECRLYNKTNNELIKKFFSSDNFGSAERMYFYVLENYS